MKKTVSLNKAIVRSLGDKLLMTAAVGFPFAPLGLKDHLLFLSIYVRQRPLPTCNLRWGLLVQNDTHIIFCFYLTTLLADIKT
jgi:hypothetical protein